jgi:hypothetical protein
MNLASLACATSTSVELIHPATGKATGVFLHGYTPDSAEWEQIQAAIMKQDGKTSVIIEKNQQRIEIDADPDKRKQLLIKTITKITGIEGYEDSVENRTELLKQSKHKWMLDAWADHTDERKHFFGQPEQPVSSGSAA